MKKGFIVLILSAAGFVSGHAQNQLNIWQRSGGVVSYSFSERPRLVFEGETLRLSAGSVTVEYPSADIQKYTFENTPSSVGSVSARLQEGGDVKIYTTDGVLVRTAAAAKDGTRTFSLDELPGGVYVVKSKSSTYKILKR